MQRAETAAGKATLKISVYALEDVTTGQTIAARGPSPKVAPLHLSTIVPATSECRTALERLASARLHGVAYDLVRVDP